MGRQDQIVSERIKKLKELEKEKINPYPYSFDKKDNTSDLQKKYSKLKPEKHATKVAKIAGRLVTFRDIGKISFGVLQDVFGKIQIVLQEDETPDKIIKLFKKFIDVGDFVGIEGEIFRTKRGELSILVYKAELLSKSILPLPEKWHGLQDKEEKYRKRYLDLIMNPSVKDVFIKRGKIVDSIRELLKKKGFNEVDTPYLQTVYGGAEARPFKTHLNALNIDLFLAISPELYLKRLIVGGFEKVFTIARNFRNEGIDRWHNPEFTLMEIYQAYTDYNGMMSLFEEIYENACKKVLRTTKVKINNIELNFKRPWKRMTMAEAIKKETKLDVLKMSDKQLLRVVKENGIEYKDESWGWLVVAMFEHFCEGKIIQPTFIIDYPKETSPLCKIHRKDERLIERFEAFCLGSELGNAYSELNNPILQKQLLEEQQKKLSKGDVEANPYDKDFVEAIETGMPPTGGLGIGIDRMIILLTAQPSIRDVIMFPFMRPEQNTNKNKKEVKNG